MNGKTFFYPANSLYTFSELKKYERLNDAGYIEATIPKTNPLYDEIEEITSKIELIKDNKRDFAGYVADVSIDFALQKHIYIVGELSYLMCSVQMQQDRSGINKAQLLDVLLKAHNEQSEEKFYPGAVEVTGDISNGLIDYGNTLDIIRAYVCGDDGYIKIAYRNNRREIDILKIETYGKKSDQYIRFGSNLLDYTQSISGDSIITAILPLGARLDNSEIEGLDSYLDIRSLNAGNKILVNQTAVNHYGYRCKVVNFGTEDVNTLMRLAKAYLSNYQYAHVTIEITAVDLSMLDSSQDDYDVGDYVRCTAEPLGMDNWFPVRDKETDILDISQNKVIIGATSPATLTQATAGAYTSIIEKLPQTASILEMTQNNATKILNMDGTNGNIVFRKNENGQLYELLFMDTTDINTAVNVWRYNIHGWGYSNNGYKGPYKTAATIDGGFVADFITTGEMLADRIRGGELKIGGKKFADSKSAIVGLNENDEEIYRIDNKGFSLKPIGEDIAKYIWEIVDRADPDKRWIKFMGTILQRFFYTFNDGSTRELTINGSNGEIYCYADKVQRWKLGASYDGKAASLQFWNYDGNKATYSPNNCGGTNAVGQFKSIKIGDNTRTDYTGDISISGLTIHVKNGFITGTTGSYSGGGGGGGGGGGDPEPTPPEPTPTEVTIYVATTTKSTSAVYTVHFSWAELNTEWISGGHTTPLSIAPWTTLTNWTYGGVTYKKAEFYTSIY